MNLQKLLSLASSFFVKVLSYHEVEMGHPIALKFGTQKGGVRVHLGTKFG